MNNEEIVCCNTCGAILDSDYSELGLCYNCIDGEDLSESEMDWMNDIPTPCLDKDEDGYEGDY